MLLFIAGYNPGPTHPEGAISWGRKLSKNIPKEPTFLRHVVNNTQESLDHVSKTFVYSGCDVLDPKQEMESLVTAC